MDDQPITVWVRWHDGYAETFDCKGARHSYALLWLELTSGQNRHIPLSSVRFFSVNPTSREGSKRKEGDNAE